MDATASLIAAEEFSFADAGFTMSWMAHAILFVNNLFQNGSELQIQRFLPRAMSGELIGAMGMSEPEAGTDVLNMQLSAEPVNTDHDANTNYYVLNGKKMWITNGPVADIFLVYARTGEGPTDLSLFVVESHFPGFSIGQHILDKCGMRSSPTAELVFDNCVVPGENLGFSFFSFFLHSSLFFQWVLSTKPRSA